jgi:hypothetical protein
MIKRPFLLFCFLVIFVQLACSLGGRIQTGSSDDPSVAVTPTEVDKIPDSNDPSEEEIDAVTSDENSLPSDTNGCELTWLTAEEKSICGTNLYQQEGYSIGDCYLINNGEEVQEMSVEAQMTVAFSEEGLTMIYPNGNSFQFTRKAPNSYTGIYVNESEGNEYFRTITLTNGRFEWTSSDASSQDACIFYTYTIKN